MRPLLWLAALVGAVVIAGDSSSVGSAGDPKRRKREHLLALARAELGQSDPAPYWTETIGPNPAEWPRDWCGGFVLAMLRRAGLAPESWRWERSKGFLWRLGNPLPPGREPQPGDLAYFHANQHHALVDSIDARHVVTIDGNSTGGMVQRNTRPRSSVAGFYSIDKLL